MSSARVAIAQHPPAVLDLEAGIERAERLVREAAEQGAALVAFSETWLGGYPVWVFGSATWDDPLAKRLHRRLTESALTVGDEACQALAALARECGVEIVMGATERDSAKAPGTLYNSLFFFGADGTLRGVHRKLVPTHAERLVWGSGDGHGLVVHETSLGRVGGLICWEHWMPLSRFALHALGEQIHIAAWPMLPEIDLAASRHYAHEGRSFTLAAAQIMGLEDLPDEIPGSVIEAMGDFSEGTDLILPGGSAVFGPGGELLAGPVTGEAAILYADLDIGSTFEELQALDTGGHYNRPDVFELTVDRRRRVPFADR